MSLLNVCNLVPKLFGIKVHKSYNGTLITTLQERFELFSLLRRKPRSRKRARA